MTAATDAAPSGWPALRVDDWTATREALHLWLQIVGKIELASTTLVNHWWNTTYEVSPRGLRTRVLMHAPDRAFDAEFDFIDHVLVLRSSTGGTETVPLRTQSVAEFYAAVMAACARLGTPCTIWPRPNELPQDTPFTQTPPSASTTRTPRTSTGGSCCASSGCSPTGGRGSPARRVPCSCSGADRFAVPFTIVAFAIAGIAWAVAGDAQRFAEVLVVATPCPLLIAAPVAFIGGMSRSARHGVIVKSGGTLEQLARVRTVAFDKTGTLTFGHPVVDRVQPSPGVEADAVARDAAAAEQYSSHVLARAIVAAAPQGATVPAVPADQVVETTGEGVTATVDGRVVAVGKASWVAGHSAPFTPDPLEPGETAVYVAAAGRPVGRIVLRDEVRPNAKSTIARLRELGVRHTLMLTGDAAATADHVAHELGISEVRAGLLPEGKVRAVAAITDRPAMMIGDGVNDAPVLAAADVGVAMGAEGSTAASESADVVIMVDDLGRAPVAISVAQRTISVAVQSIWIGISLSIVLMLVAAFGVIPAIIGAALQELVDLTSILNSLRSLGEGRRGASQSTERAGAMTASARGSTRAEM